MNQVLETKYPETGEEPEFVAYKSPYDLISDFIKMLKLFFSGQAGVFIAANLNF